MKSLFLAACLTFTASIVFAAPCSPKSKGPCTPVEGEETDAAEEEILWNIKEAQRVDRAVQKKLAAYLSVRRVDAQAPDNLDAKKRRLEIYAEYVGAKREQDSFYAEAIRLTSELYHVKPAHEDEITIGEPDEARMQYMKGLKATWRPAVTDSGPGVKLAVRIDAADGPHYTGGTENDPTKPGGRMAVTLADGRVLIMKDTFALAVKKKNLGFLAQVIYHETHHFNRLSWTDAQGNHRSWATADEEERDAYKATARIAKRIFGLTDGDAAELNSQYRKFDNAVKTGVPVTDDRLTPLQEETWKNHYEKIQINLEDHFRALAKDVEDETARQLALQDRQRAERERLAREEQAERERQARIAEEERLAKERVAEAMWQDRDAAAAVCGYSPVYQRSTGIFLWYSAQNELGFLRQPTSTRLTTNEYRLAFLINRACYGAAHDSERTPPRACNDAARLIHPFATQDYGASKLDAMFGPDRGDRGCLYHIIAQASGITDTASFDKVLAKYQKQLAKEKREYDKRWHSDPPRGNDGGRGGERPPRDDNRRPADPDHDEVRRRIGGPFRP